MHVSDLDIQQAAHLWIKRHGDSATLKALDMVEELRRKGDVEGATTWLRIVAVIETLGKPLAKTRH
jgi:hypothetical protein